LAHRSWRSSPDPVTSPGEGTRPGCCASAGSLLSPASAAGFPAFRSQSRCPRHRARQRQAGASGRQAPRSASGPRRPPRTGLPASHAGRGGISDQFRQDPSCDAQARGGTRERSRLHRPDAPGPAQDRPALTAPAALHRRRCARDKLPQSASASRSPAAQPARGGITAMRPCCATGPAHPAGQLRGGRAGQPHPAGVPTPAAEPRRQGGRARR